MCFAFTDISFHIAIPSGCYFAEDDNEEVRLFVNGKASQSRSTPLYRGAVTLELLIMFPVWLIAMLAIVQFGLLIGNRQHVALAARVGAEEASRTIDLDTTSNGDLVPSNVVQVVEQQLLNSGINQCKITLEHSLQPDPPPPQPPPPVVLSSGSCDCPTVDTPLPPNRDYVRVTVYVPATELTPNALSIFGFDISNRFVRNATTFRHEL